MPRQRSNSSAPKTGSGRYSSSKSSGYTPFTRNSRSNVPVAQPKAEKRPAVVPPAASPPAASAGRSTGDMVKDMATTAAGVAVGSAVGHAVGAGITGAFSGDGGHKAAAEQEASNSSPRRELVEEGPCAFEIREFLKCSEENSDLNLCRNFTEAIYHCRRHNNL